MLMQTLQLWKLLCYKGSICGWMVCEHYCSVCSICSWFLSPMAWICFELSQRSFALRSISKDFHGSLNCLSQLPTPCTNAACNQLARHVIIMLAGYACYCTLNSDFDFGCTRTINMLSYVHICSYYYLYKSIIYIYIYIHSRSIHYSITLDVLHHIYSCVIMCYNVRAVPAKGYRKASWYWGSPSSI